MAYEVLTAFFLEAGFLGVMLFGLERVGHKLHFFATLMVAIGTLVSAFWILSANSWMQTPTGYSINAAGQFVPDDWWKVIFNPSFPYRLVHMVLAAYLTTAFVVGAVGAYHLLKNSALEGPRVMFSMAMWMAALVAPIQIIAGDQHGLNTLEHQPVKIMAMEGHFTSHPDGAPLILFGLPDQKEGVMKFPIEIPHAGSLILKHSLDAPLKGLDTVPRENWPRVDILFWSFRVMVGIGFLMLGIGMLSLWARWRGKLHDWKFLHRFAVAMGPAGFVAVLAGWGNDGSGTAALHGLWTATHRGLGLSSGGTRSRILADCFYHRVLHRIRHGRVLHPAPDESAAASRRGKALAPTYRPVQPASRRRRGPQPVRQYEGEHHGRNSHRHRNRLGLHHRFRRLHVHRDGRLRSRPRHAVSDVSEEGGPRCDDEHSRAGVGRQRDLAGAWRRWIVCRVSTGLRHHHACDLHADHRHVDWVDLSRRRIRIFAGAHRVNATAGTLHSPAAHSPAAISQGIALGAILQGIHVEGRQYAGGWWDWLTPFSILTGLAVVAGYGLLGATWLVMKTTGELRDHAYRLTWWLLVATLVAICRC